MTYPSSVGSSSNDLADKAAESADAAIRSARQKAHDALDGLSNTMQSVKDQASATLERLRPQLDSVTSYAKEEPTKALLIAAAAGAGIMGLVALMARGSSRSSLSTDTLRSLAYDTVDQARKSARESARDAADRASAKADSLLKSTRGAAQSAYDGLADTMQQWKDQAGPLVDKVRPQIEAVTTYAKDDPGKALMIAAAAGAALMGLISSITR
jgi:ElaB/YqjD/DUF883 family membrane-anchored ribosome-binding protein